MQQLLKEGDYFNNEEMKLRAPWLYDSMVGKYVTDNSIEERVGAMAAGTWSEQLISQLEGQHARLASPRRSRLTPYLTSACLAIGSAARLSMLNQLVQRWKTKMRRLPCPKWSLWHWKQHRPTMTSLLVDAALLESARVCSSFLIVRSTAHVAALWDSRSSGCSSDLTYGLRYACFMGLLASTLTLLASFASLLGLLACLTP